MSFPNVLVSHMRNSPSGTRTHPHVHVYIREGVFVCVPAERERERGSPRQVVESQSATQGYERNTSGL